MSAIGGSVRKSIAPSLVGDDTPKRVGRFELITRLGAGGMANVYLARSQGAAGFERLAAIKLLHRHLSSDEQFVQMFFDEARVAARIHHPNVVPILDLGTERDQLYMVMDYVEGDTLAAVQRMAINLQRAVPLGIVLRIVLDALAGLDTAHDLRSPDGEPLHVVHRDISPQNILVGVDGVARLVDFGIARAERRLALTSVGTLKGKAPFMAPEQLEGRPVDRRADVFSMAVTLWESLALRRLYPQRSDVETVSRANRVPYRPLCGLMGHLPREVDPICAKGLAFDADDRYATAGDFADAIETELRGHIATHRQVAAFMAAVATDKVQRERNAVRSVSQAPTAPSTHPGTPRSKRYDSGVQALPRFNTPAPLAVPPPPAMPDLSALPDLAAMSGMNDLPDLPDLDVATSVSHMTPSIAPVRGRPAVEAPTRGGAPARPRTGVGIAQAPLVEPEPMSVRPGAGVQVVKQRVENRVDTRVGPPPPPPAARSAGRPTPAMGSQQGGFAAPPRRPEVERPSTRVAPEEPPTRKHARAPATLTGVGDHGARSNTSRDIEETIRALGADDSGAMRAHTEAISSVRRAANDAAMRQPTPAQGSVAPRHDDAAEFDLGRPRAMPPERPTMRAAAPPSYTQAGPSVAAPAPKGFAQPPRAPADASGKFRPPTRPVSDADATTRLQAVTLVDDAPVRRVDPVAPQGASASGARAELKLPSTFTPPPETSAAHVLARAAAAVSVLSAVGILWLIFR